MSRRSFQRLALPILAFLLTVVAVRQLRGLRLVRGHECRVERMERGPRGHEHRHGDRHRRDVVAEVVVPQ